MSEVNTLAPLAEVDVLPEELLSIKRNELVPLLGDQYRLNYYAEYILKAETALLDDAIHALAKQLSQIIVELVAALADSKQYLGQGQFNFFQKWLGMDLEYTSSQINYYKKVDYLLHSATMLSEELQVEIQKSNAKFQQLLVHRDQMAKYIRAAEEFLVEYPAFVETHYPTDHFSDQMAKKIQILQSSQQSNDAAIVKMKQVLDYSYALLDHFKEAQDVLIPAWKKQVKQSNQKTSSENLDKLHQTRENLIDLLNASLSKSIEA